jgi:hypothetical protein
MKNLDIVRAYLAKLPAAVSGAGGHNATFRAACSLIRFGVGDADCMTLLREWNHTHCQPPWTEKELKHKLNGARRVAGGESHSFPKPKPAIRTTWTINRKSPSLPLPPQRNPNPFDIVLCTERHVND